MSEEKKIEIKEINGQIAKLDEQRKTWLAKYQENVVTMLEKILDAFGHSVTMNGNRGVSLVLLHVGDDETHNIAIAKEVSIFESADDKFIVYEDLQIGDVVTDDYFKRVTWKRIWARFSRDYNSDNFIVPGDWMLTVKNYYEKAGANINARVKETAQGNLRELQQRLHVDIAREIEL